MLKYNLTEKKKKKKEKIPMQINTQIFKQNEITFYQRNCHGIPKMSNIFDKNTFQPLST